MPQLLPEAFQYLKSRLPRFVEQALEAGQRGDPPPMSVSLDLFQDEPLLLFAALQFARSKRVPVLFLP